jgi:hypothetical protein
VKPPASLAAGAGEPVAVPAPEVAGSRPQVQIGNAALARHAVDDQRTDEVRAGAVWQGSIACLRAGRPRCPAWPAAWPAGWRMTFASVSNPGSRRVGARSSVRYHQCCWLSAGCRAGASIP